MKTETYNYTIRSPGGGGHSFLLQCLFHLHSDGQYKIVVDPELGHGHFYQYTLKKREATEIELPNGNVVKWHFTRDNFTDAIPNSKLVYICFHPNDMFHIELKHFYKMVRFVDKTANYLFWDMYDRLYASGHINTKVNNLLDELTLDEKRILIDNVAKMNKKNHRYPDLPDTNTIHYMYFTDIFTNKAETIRNLQILTRKPITQELSDAYDFYLKTQPKPWPDVLY